MFSFSWFNSIATNELSILAFHVCVCFYFSIDWQSGFFVVLIQRFTSRNRMRKRLTETVSIKSFRLKLNILFFNRPYHVARIEGLKFKAILKSFSVWFWTISRKVCICLTKWKLTNANAETEMFWFLTECQMSIIICIKYRFWPSLRLLCLPSCLSSIIHTFTMWDQLLKKQQKRFVCSQTKETLFFSFECERECLPQCISIFSTFRDSCGERIHSQRYSRTHASKFSADRVSFSYLCVLYPCASTHAHTCTMYRWYNFLFVWLSHTNASAPVRSFCLSFVQRWVYFPFHRTSFQWMKEAQNICTYNYNDELLL